jgi:hypothetical protein
MGGVEPPSPVPKTGSLPLTYTHLVARAGFEPAINDL